jgi:hypothetical protein
MTSASTGRRDRVFPRNELKKKEERGPQGSAEKLVKLITLIFVGKEYAEFEEESRAITPKEVGAENDYFRVLIVLSAAVILY